MKNSKMWFLFKCIVLGMSMGAVGCQGLDTYDQTESSTMDNGESTYTTSSGGDEASDSTSLPPIQTTTVDPETTGGMEQPISCTTHEECSQTACNFFENQCLSKAMTKVVFVGTNPNCATADGARESPYCEIATALNKNQAQENLVIHVASKTYTAPLTIKPQNDHLKTVVILGYADGNEDVLKDIILQGSNSEPVISISSGAQVILENLNIQSDPQNALGSVGILCYNSSLRGNRLLIQGHDHGARLTNCLNVQLDNVVITENRKNGLFLNSSELKLRNSFVTRNTSPNQIDQLTEDAPIYLSNASLQTEYVTIYENDAYIGGSAGLLCNDQVSNKVHFKNSILYSPGYSEAFMCFGTVTFENSILDDSIEGMQKKDPKQESYIAIFEGKIQKIITDKEKAAIVLQPHSAYPGVFFPLDGFLFNDIGTWWEGMPKVDFLGNPRPSNGNTNDTPGAIRLVK